MPHVIDFEEIENKLFLLQQLCYSGYSYCNEYQIASESNDSSVIRGDWIRYSSRLNVLISNYLIECAIKTRIMKEYLYNKDVINTREIEKEVIDGSVLGVFKNKSELTSIHKACNKIVHAIEVKPEWKTGKNEEGEEFEYWGGDVILVGEHHGDKWELNLYVDELSFRMHLFYNELHSRVDWVEIY